MNSVSVRSAGLWWRGPVIAACAGACVGLADVARALVARHELLQAHDAFDVVVFYAAAFAPAGLVAALAAQMFGLPRRALHLGVAIGAVFFFAGAWINVSLLPGFTSTLSLCVDAALLVAAALWFRNRYRDTAIDGLRIRPWIVAGVVSALIGFAAAHLIASRDDGPTPEATATPGAARPNVLLVLCDTLRADHLGCYGYEKATSPEIDAFAKDATLFSDCRAVTPWTKPSVASLMTSLYPAVHACVEQRDVLVPEAETMAEVFRACGWRTAAFVDNAFVSPEFGLGQGFDDYDYVRPSVAANGTLLGKALFMVSVNAPVGETIRNLCGIGVDERRGCRVLSAALLARFGDPKAAPWFAYVHAMEPHLRNLKYEPTRSDAEAMGFPPGLPYLGPPPYNGILPFQTTPAPSSAQTLPMLTAQYDGAIRGFSREFGALVAELRSRGILEHTIVVLVADHGEEFHEHGGWTHGHSLHQELTRVPMIVRLPQSLGEFAKAARGQRVDGVATLLDVFPTLLDLCSIRYPRGDVRRCGASLVDALRPAKGGFPTAISDRALLGELTMSPVGIRSIRQGRWQLIVAHEPLHESVALYDDVSDPRHRRDLIDDEAIEAGSLRAVMNEKFAILERARLETSSRDLDPETAERLRRLGYVGGK